ncbi:MAG: V-type ATP synthase subunit I [Clostridiales bacterium]|nr:V-type ATP synthase subunit I [Clostridiales bacterium]
MAKMTMCKIEIIALLQRRKALLEYIQSKEIMEFSDCTDPRLVKINTAASVSNFEKNMGIAQQAREILEDYAPEKRSLLASFNGRRVLLDGEFDALLENRNEYMKVCYDLITESKSIAENRASIARLKAMQDSLEIWLDLDISMAFKGTSHTRCFIGVLPGERTVEDILTEIANINPQLDMLHTEIISSFKQQSCVAVLCHKSIEQEVYEALRQMGFVQPSDAAGQKPSDRYQEYANDISRLEEEIEKSIERIKSFAQYRRQIEFMVDYFILRRDKYEALNKVGNSKNTFLITGYIPEKFAQKYVSEIEEKFNAAVSISYPEPDEDVPVLLENNAFASPMEGITEMYAMPDKQDVDPSGVMAFFYYFFFGIMLSDAGYGLVMTIGTALALKKLNLEAKMRKTLKMFFYCGISTVFWGAMFGSWFGDIVNIIYTQFLGKPAPNLAIWFEPITDPMKFLLAAFAFGIVHLFAGVAVNFYKLWKEGKKLDAVLDTVPTYLLVLGAAPLAAQVLVPIPPAITEVGKYMALSGLVLVILTGGRNSKNIFARLGAGAYGLYNIATGYISDILSYSRLLALGLATGSIASVINLMGSMPQNPFVKGILLTVVFVVGHTLNMAINLLGAYVHTNRLQFVEFFSKFYEGGGIPIKILGVNTKYIKFREEN